MKTIIVEITIDDDVVTQVLRGEVVDGIRVGDMEAVKAWDNYGNERYSIIPGFVILEVNQDIV